ncbi:MAG: Flp family type IVb pilin [Eubacterium sp.]
MMRFIKDEDGQGMLEYVLIIALVAVVAIVAILAVRTVLQNKNTEISDQMETMP